MSSSATSIVKVVLPRRVWESYDYAVPEDKPIPAIGARVRVPLGHSRAVGIVIGYAEESHFNLRPIEKVIDAVPLLNSEVIELGVWMSSYYHHPLGSVFDTILPTVAKRGADAKLDPEQHWRLVDPQREPSFRANAKRQRNAWQTIRDVGTVHESQLKQLGIDKPVLTALAKSGVLEQFEVVEEFKITSSPLTPTDEQQQAIEAVRTSLHTFRTFLLDGVTGSGKTEVYLQIIEDVVRNGKQVLVLVPEIALTPQMTQRFQERFNLIGTLHSMISNTKRFETWARAAKGDMSIIIGTRSAVFTPFKSLGAIVVDEEHDASYKQAESLRYSARDIAVLRASKLGIPCILGSATPSLESIVNARANRYSHIRLMHRPGTAELPTFHVQDMRHKHIRGGICEPLMQRIGEHLGRGGQVLVLINRRGHSTSYFCQSCGWTAYCDDCDIKLTWHAVPHRMLQCHACGRKYRTVDKCPSCDKDGIVTLGVGTQQVEHVLAEQFPDVTHHRIDRDSIRTNRQLTSMFNRLQQTHDGLLIGTQMLAKGHHFPNVTLVAVIAADNGFLSTDFRGPERTAQLIVQVAGRAGRAEKRGEVWIQTYDPANIDLQALVDQGYGGFAETELKLRNEARMPPFNHMAVIRAEGTDEQKAEDFCTEVLDQLRQCDVAVLGPASAPISRVAKQYRFQGIVIAEQRKRLHDALSSVERMRPPSRKTRWSIDVDPIEMA